MLHTFLTAASVAESDPHGWILTLTSVSVVFGALILLRIIFGLIGKAFTKDERKQDATPEPEAAAAISLALQQYLQEGGDENETAAAVGLALDRYLSETTHDAESYVLTLRSSESTPWSHPARNFRRNRSNS